MEGPISLEEAYTALGLAPGASEEQVRRAYKKLALKHHPDKSTDPDAKTKFQQVHAAYKRITDPESFEEDDTLTDEAMFAMFEEMLGDFFFGMAGPFDSDDDDDDDDDDEGFRMWYGFGDDDNDDGGFDDDYGPFDEMDPRLAYFLLHMYGYADPGLNRSFTEFAAEMRQSGKNGRHPDVLDQIEALLSRSNTADLDQIFSSSPGMRAFGGDEDEDDGGLDPLFAEILLQHAMQQPSSRSSTKRSQGSKPAGKTGKKPARKTMEEKETKQAAATQHPSQPAKPATQFPNQVFELGPRQAADGGFTPCCGTRVLVHGTHAGRVAYAGPVHYAKGDFFGVVLDEPNGKNNGTIRGMQYFSCRPKHGLMVKASALQPL